MEGMISSSDQLVMRVQRISVALQDSYAKISKLDPNSPHSQRCSVLKEYQLLRNAFADAQELFSKQMPPQCTHGVTQIHSDERLAHWVQCTRCNKWRMTRIALEEVGVCWQAPMDWECSMVEPQPMKCEFTSTHTHTYTHNCDHTHTHSHNGNTATASASGNDYMPGDMLSTHLYSSPMHHIIPAIQVVTRSPSPKPVQFVVGDKEDYEKSNTVHTPKLVMLNFGTGVQSVDESESSEQGLKRLRLEARGAARLSPKRSPSPFCWDRDSNSNSSPSCGAVSCRGSSPDLMDLTGTEQQLQWGYHELDLSTLCVGCVLSKRNVLFQPCNHLAMCETCADKTTQCPLCRVDVTNRITVLTS